MTPGRDKHIDLWNRRELRKKSHTHMTLIYDRDGELGDKNENRTSASHHMKTNSRWIRTKYQKQNFFNFSGKYFLVLSDLERKGFL